MRIKTRETTCPVCDALRRDVAASVTDVAESCNGDRMVFMTLTRTPIPPGLDAAQYSIEGAWQALRQIRVRGRSWWHSKVASCLYVFVIQRRHGNRLRGYLHAVLVLQPGVDPDLLRGELAAQWAKMIQPSAAVTDPHMVTWLGLDYSSLEVALTFMHANRGPGAACKTMVERLGALRGATARAIAAAAAENIEF